MVTPVYALQQSLLSCCVQSGKFASYESRELALSRPDIVTDVHEKTSNIILLLVQSEHCCEVRYSYPKTHCSRKQNLEWVVESA